MMGIYLLGDELIFPPADLAGKDGLLAIEGDLSAERLILAYRNGIFPWYAEDSPIMWWSPDPRMILFPSDFKLRKSLRNTLNKGLFEIRFDTNFNAVIEACSRVPRKDQEGTWITPEMIEAYKNLHELGVCHSVEVYHNKVLVGGLYGISLGKAFFGESMFHTMTDASKVALYHLVEKMKNWNFDFIDVQQETGHLRSLGAKPLARKKFLSLLNESMKAETRKGKWNTGL